MKIPPEYRRRRRRKPFAKKNVGAKEKKKIIKKITIDEPLPESNSTSMCNLSSTSVPLQTIAVEKEKDIKSSETIDIQSPELDFSFLKLSPIPIVLPVEPIDVHSTDNILETTEDLLRLFFATVQIQSLRRSHQNGHPNK
uniref:Uncharacterized protein n=1 Tax=Vespula pensylvanica TaxID=30213 RepID=A0A834NYG4_VESPE|nr:hypothetical protein H0235_009266 [Vespula pensylvanica]